MNRASRIAIISLHTCPWEQPGSENAGGMNIYVRQTASVLARRGWSVDIFTRSHGTALKAVFEKQAGLRLIHVPAGPPGLGKGDLHRFIEPFVSAVRGFADAGAGRYDAVVSHYWLSGLAAIELAKGWGTPHVAGFHTLSLVKEGSFPGDVASVERVAGERLVIGSADHLLATSPHERQALCDVYGAGLERISVASPGVDREFFYPRSQAAARRALGLPGNSRAILAIGRPTPLKGVDVLLRALARLSDRETSLLLVGGEPKSDDQRRLRVLAEELGVEPRVRFVGSLPHRSLPIYYGACDVCVVPSFYESFGLVALEAMACGRPVIASRVGGLRALVRDGVDGRLVTPGSVDDLAAALVEVLGRPRGDGHELVPRVSLQSWSATTDAMLSALRKAA